MLNAMVRDNHIPSQGIIEPLSSWRESQLTAMHQQADS